VHVLQQTARMTLLFRNIRLNVINIYLGVSQVACHYEERDPDPHVRRSGYVLPNGQPDHRASEHFPPRNE